MEHLSYGYIQSYSSTSNSAIQSLLISRSKWKELTLIIISFVNVAIFMSFTVLDIMKIVEIKNIDKKFITNMHSGSADFPDVIVENAIIKMNTPSFTFDLLALLSVVFVPVLLLYGIISERKYDVYASILVMGVTGLFMVPDALINDNWSLWYKKVRLITSLVLTVALVPITVKTVNEKTWMEFRVPGTSDGMMDLYRRLKYFNALLHFDFFLLCTLALLNMQSGIGSSVGDYSLALSLIFYGALCLILATVAVNNEIKHLVFIFLALALLLLIWVPIQISLGSCSNLQASEICTDGQYIFSYFTISAGVFVVIVRTYLIIELLKVYRNFGYGLTDTAFVGLIVSESTSLLSRPRI